MGENFEKGQFSSPSFGARTEDAKGGGQMYHRESRIGTLVTKGGYIFTKPR